MAWRMASGRDQCTSGALLGQKTRHEALLRLVTAQLVNAHLRRQAVPELHELLAPWIFDAGIVERVPTLDASPCINELLVFRQTAPRDTREGIFVRRRKGGATGQERGGCHNRTYCPSVSHSNLPRSGRSPRVAVGVHTGPFAPSGSSQCLRRPRPMSQSFNASRTASAAIPPSQASMCKKEPSGHCTGKIREGRSVWIGIDFLAAAYPLLTLARICSLGVVTLTVLLVKSTGASWALASKFNALTLRLRSQNGLKNVYPGLT